MAWVHPLRRQGNPHFGQIPGTRGIPSVSWSTGLSVCLILGLLILGTGPLLFAETPDSGLEQETSSAAQDTSEPSASPSGQLPATETVAPETAAPDPTAGAPDILDLDIDQLGTVQAKVAIPEAVFDPDVSATGGSNSTGGLLSFAPGVITRSTSALNQDARIRGYSGSQLVGVANGMNQGKTRLDVDALFSQIDPELVESIAVIPGPYTVEYGPGYAFFDAQLIAPQRTDEPTFNSKSNFGFNTNGRQLMWRETAGFSDRHSGAIVSFGQRMGNDYRPGAHSADFNVPASYHVQDVYAAISNDVGELGRLDASFLHQSLQDTELPGVTYDINEQNADQFNLRWTQRDRYSDVDRLQMQFWWNQATYNGDASRSSKQRTFVDRLLGDPYPDMKGGGNVIANGLSDNWGTRAITTWGDSETWVLRAGADWRRIRQFYRELDFKADGSPEFFGDSFGIPDSSADDFGIFAGSSVVLTDRWKMTAGQRVDWVHYGVSATDEVVTSLDSTPNGEFYSGLSTPTRALSTTYLTNTFEANEHLAFNAGAAFAMRPPNLTELYSNEPSAPMVRFGNSYAFGDSELKSEQNLQFDLGVTSKHEYTTIGARMFHSTIHNYIGLAAANYSTYPEVGTVPPGRLGRDQPFLVDPNFPELDYSADSTALNYVYRNIDRATLYGFDLIGEHQVQPWLELVGTLTYTEGINHDPVWVDVYTGQETKVSPREGLPGIYPISALTTIRLVEPESRQWTVEWQSRFASKQGHLATSLGEIGTPGFGVHNINASYRWSDRISLRSSLLNVFNRNYYEHNSLAIIDRNGNIGFVKNPGISWFSSLEITF